MKKASKKRRPVKRAKKVVWFASSDDFLLAGPYATEVEAWEAMELSDKEVLRQRRIHAAGTYVWCTDDCERWLDFALNHPK